MLECTGSLREMGPLSARSLGPGVGVSGHAGKGIRVSSISVRALEHHLIFSGDTRLDIFSFINRSDFHNHLHEFALPFKTSM